MVQSIDKERAMGTIKHEKSVVDFFTGAGTGIAVSCLFSPDSSIRTTVIIVAIIMIGIGWYKKSIMIKKRKADSQSKNCLLQTGIYENLF